MRVLSISSDRSRRGILFPGTPAFKRQEAYAEKFENLDIIGFSLKSDGARDFDGRALHVRPTNSSSRLLYGWNALRIAFKLPKPDVISAQDPFETGFVAWLLALLRGIPLHVQVHTDFLSPEYAALSLVNRIRVLVAGFVLRRALRIRVVSNRIKESIEKRYALRARITVLPIFADIDQIRVGIRDFDLEKRFAVFGAKLLIVSRLEAEKNVELAIRAYAKVAPKDACFIIVGGGKDRERLERLSHTLSAHHVFFEGERNAAPYFAMADLVLVPSRYEGHGLVIVEALAAEKPVLSTDVGIAREAGAIVTTEEKFADALAQWFKNGPRTGELKNYPYKNFDEYVRAYCADIAASVRK